MQIFRNAKKSYFDFPEEKSVVTFFRRFRCDNGGFSQISCFDTSENDAALKLIAKILIEFGVHKISLSFSNIYINLGVCALVSLCVYKCGGRYVMESERYIHKLNDVATEVHISEKRVHAKSVHSLHWALT